MELLFVIYFAIPFADKLILGENFWRRIVG